MLLCVRFCVFEITSRPVFHKMLGVIPDWYGQEVFEKTSEIPEQVFPITMSIGCARSVKALVGLRKASLKVAEGKKRGEIVGAAGCLAGMGWSAF